MRKQRNARRWIAHHIAPFGREDTVGSEYYPQQASCQIGDIWFLYEKFLGKRSSGVFVEVGANDGVIVSNSWGLAARGWQGYFIEPVPDIARRCAENHASHPNVSVHQLAIGAPGTSEIIIHLAGTLSTANVEMLDEYRKGDWSSTFVTDEYISVPCTTLDAFLKNHGLTVDLDVLIIDVEGFETQVFMGLDLNVIAPKMLIVELADVHPDLTSTSDKDAELGTRILGAGYRVVFKDRVNTVFVRQDVWRNAYARSNE